MISKPFGVNFPRVWVHDCDLTWLHCTGWFNWGSLETEIVSAISIQRRNTPEMWGNWNTFLCALAEKSAVLLEDVGHTGRFLPCYSRNITVISWSRCGSDGQTRLSKGCWWLRAAPFGCVVVATAGRTRRCLCPSPCTSCTSTGCRSQPLRESNSIRRGANVDQRVGTQWKIVL